MAQSWLEIDAESDFSLQNLPFGIFSARGKERRAGVALGNFVVDLVELGRGLGCFDSATCELLARPNLNGFAALAGEERRQVRITVQKLFSRGGGVLEDDAELRAKVLVPMDEVEMHLPVDIGDYTDFYAGYHHAYRVGVMFRGQENALQKNYLHLPVGYHGRASTVVVSGTEIPRPSGQMAGPDGEDPTTGPSKKLDFELELGCILGGASNKLGESIGLEAASDHIFGYVLLNDWSARDLQAWEYVPLGPFNGKNFATTISPWVVVPEALAPFRTAALPNATRRQTYLDGDAETTGVYDVELEVSIQAAGALQASTVTRVSAKQLVWSFEQMVAHHSLNGCVLRAGDLLGSGTISGPEPGELGSLLEQSSNGKVDVLLQDGSARRFLLDGDTVTLRGHGSGAGGRIGFGTCSGMVGFSKARQV